MRSVVRNAPENYHACQWWKKTAPRNLYIGQCGPNDMKLRAPKLFLLQLSSGEILLENLYLKKSIIRRKMIILQRCLV